MINIAIQKKHFLLLSFLYITVTGIAAIGLNGRAVSMKIENPGKSLEINLDVHKGFGIQKKGPHEVVIYSISKNNSGEKDPEKLFSAYGKKIQELKPLKLSGTTAKQDDEYFSSVNKLVIPVTADGDIGVKAKIYYCSFNDSFCSVEVLHAIIKK